MKTVKELLLREGAFALLFVFILSSCTAKIYTPEIKSEFQTAAVCTFGEFKYNCKIVKTADYVSVTPEDTQAAGMVIKCDGKTVSFIKGSMKREFGIENVDITNPAVVLYGVFNSLDTASAKVCEDGVLFSGSISAGDYSLLTLKTGEPKKLSVDSASIQFNFDSLD